VQAPQKDRFIYIVGEQQEGIIPESSEIFAFTRDNMRQIETSELAMVIANVFARGQYFPGPDGVMTSVIHEFTSRTDRYAIAKSKTKKGRCTLITAFKRMDGEISVKVTAVIPVQPGSLNIEEPEKFHQLLVETLPDFQNVLTEEAYAPDSKLIDIIKETTLYHINKKLH
jgi:hypothetical protein